MRAYFDHNATTPVDPAVRDAMLPFFCEEFGNAGSIHADGQRARGAVERARRAVADLVRAKASEIGFTSGGTESDNLAIFGIVNAAPGTKKHVITTVIEHHAVLHSCEALERQGVAVSYLPVSRTGVMDPDDVRKALRPETVLITVMNANNELGTIQPIEAIGRIAAEADVWFHTDAVQSAGKIPIDVERFGVDLLSLSAHKIYGPKGVGALYVRKGTSLAPLLFGGQHVPDPRPGTENVPGIAGLGKAAELAREHLAEESARIAALRDRLEQGIVARVSGTCINGGGAPRVPNTANVCFDGVGGESLVIALDLKGVAGSAGAACSSGAVAPSHVLLAIGLSPDQARGSVRLSLGRRTTDAEVDFALAAIPEAVERLRKISPSTRKPVAAS